MRLIERDRQSLWHPLTQHQTALLPIPIVRGDGAYLIDDHGKYYLDLISSWWVNIHGHAHPEIAKAIYEQASLLEHVLFAGFTHEPAIQLAEQLINILPTGFSKVFFSDNGSTAVEVALKMAYQYWHNQGEPQRQRFLAFDKGYHGDTFGAMSVGKRSGFYTPFEDLLFHVEYAPYPATWRDDPERVEKEQQSLTWISEYLKKFGHQTAALIIEPLIQGSSGMRMCSSDFLQSLEQLLRQHGVLIIYDEVMTGFGRTGELFACITAKTSPDLICLSKGLTGGFLPMAATVCKENIYQAFLADNFDRAFAHGHSFTANPLGCAASLASLKLLQTAHTQQQIALIQKVHEEELQRLTTLDLPIERWRQCGTIAAFDVKVTAEYGSAVSQEIQKRCLAQGLLVRPLGNVIYLLPPYCISKDDLSRAYAGLEKELRHFSF